MNRTIRWLPALAFAAGLASAVEAADGGAPAAGGASAFDPVCRQLGAKLGRAIGSECARAGLVSTGARSVNGFPVLVKEYAPKAGKPAQARILVIGGTHGDEPSSVTIVLTWMKLLDTHHSGMFHWRVVPLLNPDGLFERVPRRTNARGVDLNRNFPTTNWQQESQAYWVSKTQRDPRRYPGPEALSEPESRWLAEEIERFRPDAIVSVHAPYNLLDFDGPPATPPNRLGSIYLSPLGTFPGSLGRYAGVAKRIPVITIELPKADTPPAPREVTTIWNDLVRWLRKNVRSGTAAAQR